MYVSRKYKRNTFLFESVSILYGFENIFFNLYKCIYIINDQWVHWPVL